MHFPLTDLFFALQNYQKGCTDNPRKSLNPTLILYRRVELVFGRSSSPKGSENCCDRSAWPAGNGRTLPSCLGRPSTSLPPPQPHVWGLRRFPQHRPKLYPVAKNCVCVRWAPPRCWVSVRGLFGLLLCLDEALKLCHLSFPVPYRCELTSPSAPRFNLPLWPNAL